MRSKVAMGLGQVLLGTIFAWAFALLLTWAFALGDRSTSHAFALGCIISGLATVLVGVVGRGPSTGYSGTTMNEAWGPRMVERALSVAGRAPAETKREGTSATVLTGLGVALMVAPPLLIVGALTFPR